MMFGPIRAVAIDDEPSHLLAITTGLSASGIPYLLVFWTQVGTKVEEVRTLLYQRLDGIPFPLAVVELPKGKFIGAVPKQKDFKEGLQEFYLALHSNTDALGKAVRDAV